MSITQKQADFIPANRRISVCAKRFYAALQFISTEQTRYYLNGVFIEPHKDGGVMMVATNGHYLAAVRDATARIDGTGGWICGLPKQPFNTFLKRQYAGTMHFVGNTAYLTDAVIGIDARLPDFDPTKITEQHLAIAYAPPIDGTFPDWRRIVPQDKTKQTDRFAINGRDFDKFTKAIETISENNQAALSMSTPPDGSSPIIIQSGNARDFFGIVMPMRDDFVGSFAPDWLNLPAPDAKPEPANDPKPAKAGKNRPVLGLTKKPVTKPDTDAA